MSKYILWTFLTIVFISCTDKEEKTLPTITDITELVYSSVTIQPDSLYQVYASVHGILDKIFVEEGDSVQKGTPLLQILNSNPKLHTENAKLSFELLTKKRASQISGVERQRVAIARALINNPTIIMGDEPTGNLDSYNSENVFNVFKQLSDEEGLSLLVVTHDTDFANKTDRIIEMGDGKIIS